MIFSSFIFDEKKNDVNLLPSPYTPWSFREIRIYSKGARIRTAKTVNSDPTNSDLTPICSLIDLVLPMKHYLWYLYCIYVKKTLKRLSKIFKPKNLKLAANSAHFSKNPEITQFKRFTLGFLVLNSQKQVCNV